MKRREPLATNEAVRNSMRGNTKKDTSMAYVIGKMLKAFWERRTLQLKNTDLLFFATAIFGTEIIIIA